MAKLTRKDEFAERLGIEMDHIKAGLMELRAKGRKLRLEARVEFEKNRASLEAKEKELKSKVGEWAKAGEAAGAEFKKGAERAAKELRKAVKDAAARLR